MKQVLTKVYLLTALLLVGALVVSACAMPDQPEVVTVPDTPAETPATEELGLEVGNAGIAGAQDVLVTASSLFNLRFENQAGEDIGEIENFLVNMENGQISYATIEYGGVLDMGDRAVALPLTAFTWTPMGEMALAFPEETLENYPNLDQGWADFTNPAWDDQVAEFWQGAGIEPGVSFDEAADNLAWASELIGYGVEDLGFGAGTVNDMLIDLGQGMAQFIVLAYEPGIFDNELVAVPFSAFTWQGMDNDLAFAEGITQEVLTAAPSFAAADLEAGILDSTWDDNFFTYWEDAGFAVAPGVAAGETTTEPAGTAGETVGQGVGVAGASDAYVLGTTLLDYDFENIDGQVSGNIQDLIIDTETGRILFVAIEYGGFLDIGDTELPVPLSAFTIGPAGQLVLGFEEEILQDFPDVGTNWGDFTDPAWEDDAVSFWRNAGFDPGFDFTEATTGIVHASTLIGYPVADIGYGVSNVQNIVVDLGQARAPYMLVDYDTLGVGNELVAVPFSAFDPGRFGSEFVFDEGWDAGIVETAPILDPVVLGAEPFDPALLDEWNTYWEERGISVTENE